MDDSGGSFDFRTAFDADPGPVPARYPVPMTAAPPDRSAVDRRGQRLGWIALALALVAGSAVGGGLFATLGSIDLPVSAAIDDVQTWMTVTTVGLCLALVAVALAVVALVRSHPRSLAVVALLVAVVVPPLAAVIGVRAGVDVLLERLHDAGDQAASLLAGLADEYARTGAVNVAALLQLVQQLIHD